MPTKGVTNNIHRRLHSSLVLFIVEYPLFILIHLLTHLLIHYSVPVAGPEILVGVHLYKKIVQKACDYFRSCPLNWNHTHIIIAANKIETNERPENVIKLDF